MAGGAESKADKAQKIAKLYELFGSYKQIILTQFTNVGSNQIQQIRKALRSYNSVLIIAKNTLVKKVIQMRTEGIVDPDFKHLEQQFGGIIPELKVLSEELQGKIAIIFSEANAYELKQKIEANKIPTEARVGVVSPVDYTVPPGPTGLDPSQINFFHALNISTKIVRGQIQITKDFRVCVKGKKIKASEAALLKKLNLKPFEYGMKISCVYDEGAILPENIINIDPSTLIERFQFGVKNLAALSIGAGLPIEATVPIIIANSFRNIAALSLESGLKIKELSLLAAEAPKADKKPAEEKKAEPKKEKEAKKEAPPPPPKEEEEDVGMGGLFD